MRRNCLYYVVLAVLLGACRERNPNPDPAAFTFIQGPDTPAERKQAVVPADTIPVAPAPVIPVSAAASINTGNTSPSELLAFARTLIGVPYLYASTDPAKGFDCSGFITYVFNHFGISVPRSSVDFTNAAVEVPAEKAMPGDLILFTGTDSTIRVVGHMGIIESREGAQLKFIHSTSGKGKGVVITPFEKYYQGRFVKTIRIFPERFFTP